MSQSSTDFDLYLPAAEGAQSASMKASQPLRKFTAQLPPGRTQYDLKHNFRTLDVVVQTRIAGNVREGGVSVLDENTVRITFGGSLNEPMDVVIIG